MVDLPSEYGRCGYRRITALLQVEGFRASHKPVERLWRRYTGCILGRAAQAAVTPAGGSASTPLQLQ
ncbi:MAG: IS3 family transposase [Bacteroidota bacterium]